MFVVERVHVRRMMGEGGTSEKGARKRGRRGQMLVYMREGYGGN